MKPVCGAVIGENGTSRACSRAAGWGTDHKGEGRCKDHDDAALAKMQTIKNDIVRSYATGEYALRKLCLEHGYDQATIWRWRQSDEAFDRAMIEAQASADAIRLSMVEDATFRKLIDPATPLNAGITAYWLGNRSKGRWRDVRSVVHEGGDKPIQYHVTNEQRNELEALLQRMNDRRSRINSLQN